MINKKTFLTITFLLVLTAALFLVFTNNIISNVFYKDISFTRLNNQRYNEISQLTGNTYGEFKEPKVMEGITPELFTEGCVFTAGEIGEDYNEINREVFIILEGEDIQYIGPTSINYSNGGTFALKYEDLGIHSPTYRIGTWTSNKIFNVKDGKYRVSFYVIEDENLAGYLATDWYFLKENKSITVLEQ